MATGSLVDALESHYALTGTLRRLPGDVDENWELRSTEGARFLVKVSRAIAREALGRSTRILAHVAAADAALPVERVVPTRAGDPLLETVIDADPATVRVTGFLPGSLLGDLSGPLVPVMTDLGRKLAQLDTALASFPPEAHVRHPWELSALDAAARGLDSVPDAALAQQLATYCSDMWPRTREALGALPVQLIHNDLDGDNVLATQDGVCGLLDFGDASHAPRVVDLAVTAAYVQSRWSDASATRSLIAGYTQATALDEREQALLPHVVRARNALRTINAFAGAAEEPDNAAYRLRNARRAAHSFAHHDDQFWKGMLP